MLENFKKYQKALENARKCQKMSKKIYSRLVIKCY